MTELTRLKVSLTKHGAHKISRLLKHFPADQVLENIEGVIDGINIDGGQARKNLSANPDGSLPRVWHEIQNYDGALIDRCCFLAIALSHHELINALRNGATGTGTGVIAHDDLPGTKSFTNFKNDIIELGFETFSDSSHVRYDLSALFSDERLPPFVREVIRLKLVDAGWDGETAIEDEAISLGFHEALGLLETEFRNWLNPELEFSEGSTGSIGFAGELDEDNEFGSETISEFAFRAGHSPRETGTQPRAAGRRGQATLRHNALQNQLYESMCEKYGPENVGTEVQSGVGNAAIDIVLKHDGMTIFFEIKTARSIRACIREALSQLTEYAYWPNVERADRLVIVSTLAPTDEATTYLDYLRETFGLPISYQRFDEATGQLAEAI